MKKIRNLIKALSVLTMMLIVGCQEDSFVDLKQNETAPIKSFYSTIISKEAIQTNEKLFAKMTSLAVTKYNQIGKNVYNETYGFTINTDVAKLVENTNGNNHSYTFSIDTDNHADSSVKNLVFSYDAVNDDYSAGLVTYHFSAAQKQEYLANRHVSSPYNISFSSIDVSIDDVLNKNMTVPCNTIYTTYHITPDTNETFLYSMNGVVQNTCVHENDDDPCDTYTVIEIDCPDGGTPSSSHDTGTSEPTDTNTNDYSNTGGSGNSNDTEPNEQTNTPIIITSLLTKEEMQQLVNDLNDLLNNVSDTVTESVNGFLTENNNSIDAITTSILYLENVIADDADSFTDYEVPPSCDSFNFTSTSSNWQEAAVKNIRFKVRVLTPTGTYINFNVKYSNPILFGMPKNMAIGGDISNGLAAELSAQALKITMDETVAMYGNKLVTELQVRLYFEKRLKINYPLITNGGRVNINSMSMPVVPTEYQTNFFGTGNCD